MLAIIKATVGGMALFAATTGLAGPATAEVPDGTYQLTVIQGDQHIHNGAHQGAKFSPCGPDCLHVVKPPEQTDLHLQGGTWFGAAQVGSQTCTLALDDATSNLTEECPAFDLHVVFSMAKKG